MKKLLLIFILLFSFELNAQQDSTDFKTKFGIGITFGQELNIVSDFEFAIYPMTIGNIYFPIDLSEKFRMEPELGYFNFSYDHNGNESSFSNLRFGLGLFHIIRYTHSIITVGGRAGLISSSQSYSNAIQNEDDSKTDYYFGFATGGEYLFNEHISLGGEAQFNYISLGTYNDEDDRSTTILSTRALVVLRIYY